MRLISILIILLITTKLVAQIDQRCYNHDDLRRIALKLIKLKETDTLYKSNEKIIFDQNLKLINKDKEIKNINRIVVQKDSILLGKDSEIKVVNLHLKKVQKKALWHDIGWGSTTAGLIAVIVLIVIHK